MTNRAIANLFAFNTNQLRTPLFHRQPLNSLFLHCQTKLHQLGLIMVSLIRSSLRIRSQIRSSCPSSLGGISSQFPTNSGRIYSKFRCNLILFHSGLNKGFNLISLYQTKLSVIFCHSNQKVALLGQKAKSYQKLFCLLFKNCTYYLNLHLHINHLN